MRASDVFHELVERTSPQNALLLTSGNTGNPALSKINAGLVPNLVSLTYSDTGLTHFGDDSNEHKGLPMLDVVSTRVKSLGPFDITFVDPFHSYTSSLEALALAIDTSPTGWIVVHDCLPTFVIAGDDEIDGEWSGSTFAAFQDLMRRQYRDRAWFIVDSDFGIGVIAPIGTAQFIEDSVSKNEVETWLSANLEDKRRFLLENSRPLFRAIEPVALHTVLEHVLSLKSSIVLPSMTENLSRSLQLIQEELVETQQRLEAIEASRSWKITAPYRALGSRLHKHGTRPED
jgi:hypothetical protein